MFRDGVAVAEPTGASWVDDALTNGTSYTYVVRSLDTFGQMSSQSSAVTARPLPAAPAAPAAVRAKGGDAKATVSWDAVDEAVRYQLRRDGIVIEQVDAPTTGHVDTGLENGVAVTYSVTSVDAYGQKSAASPNATVTPVPPSPGSPTGLAAQAGDTVVTLTWSPVTGANRYAIDRNGVEVARVTSTAWSDTAVANGTTYFYTVRSLDRFGQASDPSATVSARPLPPIPDVPDNVTATPGDTRVTVAWSGAARAAAYEVRRGATLIKTITAPALTYTETGLPNGTAVTYTVTAVDNYQQRSAASAAATATPLPAPPADVTGLTGTAHDGRVALVWQPAARATRYEVFRNNTKVATTAEPSWSDNGVVNGTTYSYYVRAADDFNQYSAASVTVLVRPVPPVPSTPQGFTATGGDGVVTLAWDSAAGVTAWRIHRDGALLRTITTNPATDTSVTNGVGHSYAIQAEDAYGQLSPLTAPKTAVPHKPSTTAPPAAKGVSAKPVSSTSASVSWSPVEFATGYRVQRSTSSNGTYTTVGTVTGVSFDDTALSANSFYFYRVVAFNDQGDAPASGVSGVNTSTSPTPSASGVSSSQVTVSWSALPGIYSNSYVQRATSVDGPFTTVVSVGQPSYSWADTTVEANTTYYYRVFHGDGGSWTSLPSAAVVVKTLG